MIRTETPADSINTPTFMSTGQTATMTSTPCESIVSQPPAALVPPGSFFDDAIETSGLAVDAAVAFSTPHKPCTVPQPDPSEPKPTSPYQNQTTATNDEGRLPTRRSTRREKRSKMNIPNGDQGRAASIAETTPKPRKRGRKPKPQSRQDSESVSFNHEEEELDEDGLPLDPRRRRVLERNRIAATKCRLRKRDEASALASREHVMEDQNRYLMYCFDSLTTEIYNLKTQLLRHTDCGCVLIQKYIAHEAKKSIDNMLGAATTTASGGLQGDGSMSQSCGGSSSHIISPGSMNTNSEGESVQGSWTTPFQSGSALETPQDEVLGQGLSGQGLKDHQALSMALDQPTSMPLTMPGGHLDGYGSGLLAAEATQNSAADEGIVWDPSWETPQ